VKAEKIAKGLCYYYDQPFEKGHKCGSKSTQLFLAEVQVEDEQDREKAHEFFGEINFDSGEMEP